MPDSTQTVFTFEAPADTRWRVVNDGVMGGRSQGFVGFEGGVLVFTGETVTQGGGFTSVRIRRDVDASAFDGVELRVRGGGRTFEVEVDDGTWVRRRPVSRRASFPTTGDWQTVRVPFSALQASVFGRAIDAPGLDRSAVGAFGLYIVDGQDGPFRLEVDHIGLYRDDMTDA
ncbi:MAG: CIA30 family protein [Bacteroidota bacterium]